MQVCGKILVLQNAQKARELRQTFFFKFELSHKLQLLNVMRNIMFPQ